MKRSSSTLHTTEPQRTVWSDELLSKLRASLERQVDVLRPLDGSGAIPLSREDLVGEVLLRLLAQDPREIRSPLAYARTALRNLVRDKIRELERAQRFMEDLANAGQSDASPGDAAGNFEDGELLRVLFERTELSPIQKQVIQMMYFDGLKLCDVARELGKNPGTIHRHHNRAIEKLARCAAQL